VAGEDDLDAPDLNLKVGEGSKVVVPSDAATADRTIVARKAWKCAKRSLENGHGRQIRASGSEQRAAKGPARGLAARRVSQLAAGPVGAPNGDPGKGEIGALQNSLGCGTVGGPAGSVDR